MSAPKFEYRRLIQFYETDAMGIVHHANYVLMMEEARLMFLRQLHSHREGDILEDINYPVLTCQVDYHKPLEFNQEVIIEFDVSSEGAKLIFDYRFMTKSFPKPVAFGKTVHVAFDMKTRRARKLPAKVLEFLAEQGK